jgi:hypothetical protein
VQDENVTGSEANSQQVEACKASTDSSLLFHVNRGPQKGYKYYPSSSSLSAENGSFIPELIRLLIPSHLYGERLITPIPIILLLVPVVFFILVGYLRAGNLFVCFFAL